MVHAARLRTLPEGTNARLTQRFRFQCDSENVEKDDNSWHFYVGFMKKNKKRTGTRIIIPDKITGGQITQLQLETNKSPTEGHAQLADI